MNRGIHLLFLLAFLLAALTPAVAGCGGDSGSTVDTGERTTAVETTSTVPPEPVMERPKKGAWGVVFGVESLNRGRLIYDLSAHTLYAFDRDRGSTPTCYGACARTWPPALTEGGTRAGGVAHPGKIGTTKRRDGTIQLTYAGYPLYRYSRDRQSDLKGNGLESFGGEWSAIRPSGEKLLP